MRNAFTVAGAGANASKPSKMVLFPYSPMSELVWSQTEGLGIKYTSESEFGKVSLFWSTESFNIVIPPTNNFTEEEKIQLHVNSEMVTGRNIGGLFGANRSLSDVLPVPIVRRQVRESRSCGQINLTNKLNMAHAQVRMLHENFEKDEESTNSSVKKSANSSHEKGPANDGVSNSIFQPSNSYQENFKENFQTASSSSLRFLYENLQEHPRATIKGKEKIVCEKERAANRSDDSNESVESTGSIVSKRKRQWFFSSKLNDSGMKNKRPKTEVNKSSFMNWISAISNGFASSSRPAPVTPLAVANQQQNDEKGPSSSSHNFHENHSSGKALAPVKPMGFGSLFNALYRQNVTISSCSSKREDFCSNNLNQEDGDFDLNENHTDPTQDEIEPKNQNKGKTCVLQTTVQLSLTSINESRSSEEKRNRDMNGGYLDSLWVTRLLSKEASTSQPRIEDDVIDLNKEPNDCLDENTDQKLKSNLNLILPSSRNKESEAIVSLFAKRLGAIKHAKPLNYSNCKNKGNVEENLEGSGSPNKDRRMVLWLGDRNTSAKDSSERRNIGLMEVQSSSAEKCDTSGNSALPNPKLFAHVANEDATAIFEAVRRLRLSRTDVLRWLKSQIQQAALDGFFLRLRLGNLKEGVGRSGYCVARINGLSGENCLSVSIGNFSCLVECHCISNQDFLEDELSAWFTASLKDSTKLPSKEELDRKLKERDLVVKKS